jgi:hypothetical protein
MAIPDNYNILAGYPKILTNSDWQKKKSFMDKAKKATKTGLGAELLKAEAAFKKIKWETLDAKMQGKFKDGAAIRAAKVKAQQHYTSVVKPTIKALELAASKARVTYNNPALSSTAKTAAKAISAEALKQSAAMLSVKFDDFDEVEQRWQAGVNLWRGRLKGNVAKLESELKELATKPSVANWTDDVTQAFRSVANSLGNNPEFADIWPTWQPWDGLQHTRHPKLKGKKTTPEIEKAAILELINQVDPHLKALKQRVD